MTRHSTDSDDSNDVLFDAPSSPRDALAAAFGSDSDSDSEDEHLQQAGRVGRNYNQVDTNTHEEDDVDDDGGATLEELAQTEDPQYDRSNYADDRLGSSNNSGHNRIPGGFPDANAASSSSQASEGSNVFSTGFFNRLFNRGTILPTAEPSTSDGVFSNTQANDDDEDKPTDETPPTYEEAAADATPPYWATTILHPGYAEEVFIDGLPVGSPISFLWNMTVSSVFQFIGFVLTYLLHTSHSAKQGSRAGLGLTVFQIGMYMRNNNGSPTTDYSSVPAHQFVPSDPNNFDVPGYGSNIPGNAVIPTMEHVDPSVQEQERAAHDKNVFWSGVIMVVGALVMLKALWDYWRARRMELIVLQTPVNVVTEEDTPETAV
ncbi:Metal homeostatis protein [Yarrowia sp. B02]|nr:Metal homeostatis protein [Yarrowia sp. B02]